VYVLHPRGGRLAQRRMSHSGPYFKSQSPTPALTRFLLYSLLSLNKIQIQYTKVTQNNNARCIVVCAITLSHSLDTCVLHLQPSHKCASASAGLITFISDSECTEKCFWQKKSRPLHS